MRSYEYNIGVKIRQGITPVSRRQGITLFRFQFLVCAPAPHTSCYMYKKMKFLQSVFAIIFLVSCASYETENQKEHFLLKNDSLGTTIYDGKTYYLITSGDLKKVRKKDSVTYVGSTKDYHLFREWLKVLSVPDEISFFAIKKEDCTVETERSPEEEALFYSRSDGHRAVELSNDKCVVRRDRPFGRD
jgi:hypothetical protein